MGRKFAALGTFAASAALLGLSIAPAYSAPRENAQEFFEASSRAGWNSYWVLSDAQYFRGLISEESFQSLLQAENPLGAIAAMPSDDRAVITARYRSQDPVAKFIDTTGLTQDELFLLHFSNVFNSSFYSEARDLQIPVSYTDLSADEGVVTVSSANINGKLDNNFTPLGVVSPLTPEALTFKYSEGKWLIDGKLLLAQYEESFS